MANFLWRRLMLVVPALLGLTVLMFILIRVVPSDPAASLAGDQATPAQIAEIRQNLGLDKPLYEQFGRYLLQVARGDFGTSLYSGRPVGSDIAFRLPATLELTFAALLIAVVFGVALGVVAAVWRNSIIDYALRTISMAGLALASFWVAIMLQLLFSMELEWLPLRGRLPGTMDPPPFHTGSYLVDSLLAGDLALFIEAGRHLALPAFTLSLAGLAAIARFTRSAMIETLQLDFVAYERAVGYPGWRIVSPYALRNSLITPVTQIGLLFGSLIASAVPVEAIFDWPGVGSYLVLAILSADYKAILAVTLVIGFIYAFVNIAVDLAHGWIDPRVAENG